MTERRITPRSAAEWASVVPVWLGIAGLTFCAIFWAFTDRIEPALLTAFGGILAAGQGAQALQALKEVPERLQPKTPPAPETALTPNETADST